MLIAATNRKDALDPALLSRFRETLDVPLPDRAQRLQLLDILLAPIAITPASRAALVEWIASDDAAQSSEPKRAAVGMSHRDIDQLVHKVLGHAMRRVRKAASELAHGRLDDAVELEAEAEEIAITLDVELVDVVAAIGDRRSELNSPPTELAH